MLYLEKFIEYSKLSHGKNNNNAFQEFEIKYLLHKDPNAPKFMKFNNDASIKYKQDLFIHFKSIALNTSEIQTINFIKQYNKTNKSSSKIKELQFQNGIQLKELKKFYQKTRLHTPIYLVNNDNNFKITLNLEEPTEEVNDYDLLRFKQRFRFVTEYWNIDFTFVITSQTKNIEEIKTIRDKLFINTNIDSIFADNKHIWDFASSIEVEFEYNKPIQSLEIEYIQHALDIVYDFNLNKHKHETLDVQMPRVSFSTVCNTNTEINEKNILQNLLSIVTESSYNDNIHVSKNTLKKILPNAIEINKRQYFEDILPVIDNFYMTDKADGIRTILIINTNIAIYNTEYKLLGKNFMFPIKETVLECEMIDDMFYVFDILKYNGVVVANQGFSKRLHFMQLLVDTWDKLHIKKFIKLDSQTYAKNIRQFISELNSLNNSKNNKQYYIDGIIFTSVHKYNNARFYKWKDIDNMTIDFLVKKCPDNLLGISPYISKPNKELYILFSGIKLKEYKKLNLTKIKYYDIIFNSFMSSDYFPIQFSPSDNTMAYLFWNDDKHLDGKIVELRYKNNDWDLVRIRNDRSDDINKKNYYGNHFKVAELIWRNYFNPLSVDDLCANVNDLSTEFYFKKHNSKKHESIRKFNNMVKSEIIQRYSEILKENATVIDLGCGKGQDLFKYANMKNITDVLFVDNNENNLSMLIDRKYKFTTNHDKNSLGIYIKNLDLSKDWQTNLKSIKESHPLLKMGNVKLIVCNFAIHYFTKSADDINNLVALIHSLLAFGGRFIFTCLDGEKIFDLLRRSSYNKWGDDNKYLIKPNYKKQMFKGGEEIEILLPFSDIPYKEYLVNLTLVKRCLERKKIMQESVANFGEVYLEKYNQMISDSTELEPFDDYDLQYIKLLYFAVYYKK